MLFRLNNECATLKCFFLAVDNRSGSIHVLTYICVSTFKNLILILVADHFHTCSPVTTAQWSKLVDSCVCCRLAFWSGWAGHSESQPGRLRWSGWFSGRTEPAASAPLLHSSGCTPPTLLQTSWDNTTQACWVNTCSSSITYSDRPAGIHKWHDNCTVIATGEDPLCCI